ETGINRNTITALYHNKVDGIKFGTLEKICETYALELTDVLDLRPANAHVPSPPDVKSVRMYRQEGDLVPFTIWWPMLAAFEHSGSGYGYYKEAYGFFYWNL